MTAIEEALFIDGSAHCISAFSWSPEALALTLHPWFREDVVVQAHFAQPCLVSFDDSHAGEERGLPWDIIAFDSKPLPGGGGWRFCVHTDCNEYVFDATCPQITRFVISQRQG